MNEDRERELEIERPRTTYMLIHSSLLLVSNVPPGPPQGRSCHSISSRPIQSVNHHFGFLPDKLPVGLGVTEQRPRFPPQSVFPFIQIWSSLSTSWKSVLSSIYLPRFENSMVKSHERWISPGKFPHQYHGGGGEETFFRHFREPQPPDSGETHNLTGFTLVTAKEGQITLSFYTTSSLQKCFQCTIM